MSDEHHGEIVIIKRKINRAGGHHGGAWKIAFADFMTAMMAFFLVLWIINATDKDTKVVIARYFNPVKLENPARARKGVHGVESNNIVSNENTGEQTPGVIPDHANGTAAPSVGMPPKKDEKPKAPAAEPHPEPANAVDVKPTMSETALFSDPYKSLDKISGGRAVASPAAAPDTGSSDPTREAGSASIEAFRDPFKPVGPGAPSDSVTMEADAPQPPTPNQPPDLQPQRGETSAARPTASATPAPAEAKPAPEPSAAPSPAASGPATGPAVAGPATGPLSGGSTASAAAQVQQELQSKLGALAKSDTSPAIEVRVTDGGLLISLTDRLTFSMFPVGSAEPRPEVVSAMEAIASVLKARPGALIVRGHTDARPYKSATYDNWRLSSARAQMAYYMLTRAGIPEARIDRIEGHADRALRDPAHPMAAENRRIEILLREAKP